MCKSKSEGGQRCAAHTRPRFESTSPLDPAWEQVAIEYASTSEGEDRLKRDAAAHTDNGDYEAAARLNTILARGRDLREANKEAAEAIAAADLTKWEPANIDGELARLYGETATLRARRDSAYDYVSHHVARDVHNRGFRGTATPAEVEAAVAQWRTQDNLHPNTRTALREYDKVEQYDAQLATLRDQMKPYNREFDRRGGWNRAFLVVNNGTGHVHRGMACSTCRPTTQYHWVTEMSDKTEAEIVEAAGERACTTCWPSAPVSVRNRPTQLFTPEERAQQRSREERATAAEQRNADKIAKALTPDGSEYTVECTRLGFPTRERFKTERAATTWMVSNMADFQGWMSDREMDASMHEAHEGIIRAIADKHGKPIDDVRADIDKKVQAKIRRDARG